MWFAPRLHLKSMSELCRRLAISSTSGIDIRKTWQRETERARPNHRAKMQLVLEGVSRGDSLYESVCAAGSFFPEEFREFVQVGEQSGTLAETLRRLADHYEFKMSMSRAMRESMFMPLLELGLLAVAVGVIIYLPSVLTGDTVRGDLLKLGLTGARGLMIYAAFLAVVITLCVAFGRALAAGEAWTKPIYRLILVLPGFGYPLMSLALANFTWSLQMMLDSAVPLRRSIELALRSTKSSYFMTHTDSIWQSIRRGNELHVALGETGVFPITLIDAIAVGEQSGRLTETLSILARNYVAEAQLAAKRFAQSFGWVVWLLYAVTAAFMILRVAGSYVDMLKSAMPDVR